MTGICSIKGMGVSVCKCMLSCFSCVSLFAILWAITHQAPLSMGLSRQEYWSGLPCPSQGDLPNPGIESMCPASPALQADPIPTEPPGKPHGGTGEQKWRVEIYLLLRAVVSIFLLHILSLFKYHFIWTLGA